VPEAALLPLQELTTLWFQVTGLLCNLECTHCLVDSSPRNHALSFLDRTTIRTYLREAERLGVKEIYYTGGEPFLHKEMTPILEDSLAVAPTTVLTNGTLITARRAEELGRAAAASRYSLEIRISMDHPDPDTNDRVRGPGTHARALRAARRLQEAGILPIITATEYVLEPSCPREGSVYERFRKVLGDAGIDRPRLKILPVFHTGKLEDPARGGVITEAMLAGIDPGTLQCSGTRAVAADGIYACPILVGKEEGFLARGPLAGALGPVRLAHHACRTCLETGMTCSNL
jgi:sulfatase maturation enzyme AslB (radical SAM superfamily)